jgi:hypothetical protein
MKTASKQFVQKNGIVFLLVLATGILAAPQLAFALIPDAQNDEFSTPEDTTFTLIAPGVLGNDSDPEDDSLTAELESTTTNGELFFNADGSFDYTPNADFVGTDSFSYHANDGTADGNTATVTINVISVNDLPQAVNDEYSTEESTQLVVSAPGVLDNDTDTEDDTLTAELDSTTTNGVLVLNPDGSFDYTPNADFVGEDSFSYHANDGTDDSNTATVTIQVNPQESIIDFILEQIQMLFDKIFSVESEVAELKEQNAALESRVVALEAKMSSGSSDDHTHDDHNHDKKSVKNEIKALKKEYKTQKEMLKDEFKEKERMLKHQIKDSKHDKHDDDDDDDDD